MKTSPSIGADSAAEAAGEQNVWYTIAAAQPDKYLFVRYYFSPALCII